MASAAGEKADRRGEGRAAGGASVRLRGSFRRGRAFPGVGSGRAAMRVVSPVRRRQLYDDASRPQVGKGVVVLDNERIPPGTDPDKASVARMYDAMLGGQHN